MIAECERSGQRRPSRHKNDHQQNVHVQIMPASLIPVNTIIHVSLL
jgi:hypothetical protein